MTTTQSRTLVRSVVALLALALAAIGLVVATAGPAHAATVPATRQQTLRPVTSTGHAASGWKVVTDTRAAITCTDQSLQSVDGGVDTCGSSADNTLACWPSATPHRVLCWGDGLTHTLRSIALSGTFVRHAASAHPQPIELLTRAGLRFEPRDGGAWGAPKDHPTWVGWFYQRGPGAYAVYGPASGDGINRTHATWSVTVYGSLDKPGYVSNIDIAYLLGTGR